MRAIEFKSRIKDNRILIPRKMQKDIFFDNGNNVRVVVFLKDNDDVYEEKAYRKMTKNQFLKGYAETDSIYDF